MRSSLVAFIGLAAGIIAAAWLQLMPLVWLIAGLGLLTAAAIGFIYWRSTLGWLLVGVICCSGGFVFTLERDAYEQQLAINQLFDATELVMHGILLEEPTVVGDGEQIRFTVLATAAKAGQPVGRISVYYAGSSLPEDWYGRSLQLTGRFSSLAFELGGWPNYYEKNRLTGSLTLQADPQLVTGPTLSGVFRCADSLRRRTMEFGRQSLRGVDHRLLHGMIYGEALPEGIAATHLKAGFRNTGTVHLLTVSGLHVNYVVLGINLLLGWLKVPKRLRIFPLLIGVGFYMIMTGLKTPVLRSGLMLMILLVAELLGSKADGLNRLSLAGCLLLLMCPNNLFEASFQLSFIATAGVVWLFPALQERFCLKQTRLRFIGESILLSIGVQLALTPVMICYFQQLSWISPIVNLFLIFPAELAVVAGIFGELVGLLVPGLGWLILQLAAMGLWLIREIVGLFSRFSWISWSLPRWPWLWVVGYYLGLALLLDRLRPSLLTGKPRPWEGREVFFGVLIAFNLIIWGNLYIGRQSDYLELSLIDAGKAGAVLVRTPEGSNLLWGGGSEGKGRSKVVPFLKKQGVQRLQGAFIGENSQDQLFGLAEVLEEVPVDEVYLPENLPWEAESVGVFLTRCRQLAIPVQRLSHGTKFTVDGKTRGEIILNPLEKNENVAVFLINFGANRLLLTGDLSGKSEKVLIEKFPQQLRVPVLRTGRSELSLAFLTQVQPKVLLLSSNPGKRSNYPSAALRQRFRSLGIEAFSVKTVGDIKIRLYKDRITVIPNRGGF